MSDGNRAKSARVVVTHEVFVKAWAASRSVAEVAKAVGLTYSGAQARAKFLREAGVKLPRHARRTRRELVNVPALNALLAPARRSRS